MAQTYAAILRGDHLEWTGEAPGPLAEGRAVAVEVTIFDQVPGRPDWGPERQRQMIEALERLASRNALAEIADPVAWQREIRQDRPLPGREP